VATLHDPNKFLNYEKSDDPNQNPETNTNVVRVMTLLSAVTMTVSVPMVVFRSSTGHDGMRDQMEKGIAKEAPRSETQKNLEEVPLLFGIVQGNKKEDKEGSSTDDERRHNRFKPQVRILLRDGMGLCGLRLLGCWCRCGGSRWSFGLHVLFRFLENKKRDNVQN